MVVARHLSDDEKTMPDGYGLDRARVTTVSTSSDSTPEPQYTGGGGGWLKELPTTFV